MALTDAGKAYVMNNDMKTATLYVGLSGAHAGVSDQSAINEASGQGYARKVLPAASGNRLISPAGVMTLAGNQVPLEVYTPSAAGAVDHSHGALFDAASAGSRLTEWVALSPNVAAPVNGQVYRLTQVTLTP